MFDGSHSILDLRCSQTFAREQPCQGGKQAGDHQRRHAVELANIQGLAEPDTEHGRDKTQKCRGIFEALLDPLSDPRHCADLGVR